MDTKCLELLSKLEKCLQDPEFQLILVMRMVRVFGTLTLPLLEQGGKDESKHSDL